MTSLHSVVLLAGAAVTLPALGFQPELSVAEYRSITPDRVGQIYYHVASGEMIRIDASGSQRNDGYAIWLNTDIAQCEQMPGLPYLPVHDDSTGEDWYTMDWGDLAAPAMVDCFTVLYLTTVPDPEADGEPGYAMRVGFMDGIDWCCNIDGCHYNPVLDWSLPVPGAASGLSIWLVTVDLSGLPDVPFALGAEGDIDADGRFDFGYGYHFDHPEGAVNTMSGVALVAPPERTEPNSLGDEDVFALWTGGWNDMLVSFNWYGGYTCTDDAGDFRPWASAYIGIYGPGNPCPPDRNADGSLDFFDVQDFLADFAAHDASADINDDSHFDFFDVQLYLGQFSAGCP